MHGSWEPFHHGGFPSILGLQLQDTCSPRPFAPSCFLLKPLLDQLLPVGSPGQSGRAGCTQLLRRHDNGRWR